MQRLPLDIPKMKLAFVKEVETGNLPFTAVLFVIYLPTFCMEVYKAAGLEGIIKNETSTPIGAFEECFTESLIHICDSPELYVSQTCSFDQYHQAIHMLANIITHMRWYPNAKIRSEEV